MSSCCAYSVPGRAFAGPEAARAGGTAVEQQKAPPRYARLSRCPQLHPPGQLRTLLSDASFSPQHSFPSFLLLFSLHIVPILNFFVAGATSRLLQLFIERDPSLSANSHPSLTRPAPCQGSRAAPPVRLTGSLSSVAPPFRFPLLS